MYDDKKRLNCTKESKFRKLKETKLNPSAKSGRITSMTIVSLLFVKITVKISD